MPINWFRGRESQKQKQKPEDLDLLLDQFLRIESTQDVEAWVAGHPSLAVPEAIFKLREKCQSPPPGISPARAVERMKWLAARLNQGPAARGVVETTAQEQARLHPARPGAGDQAAPKPGSSLPDAGLPDDLQSAIVEIVQASQTPENAPAILIRCERILSDPWLQKQGWVRALVLNAQARAYFLNYRGNIAENFEAGLQALVEAGRLVQKEDLAELWGDIQANTGLFYLFRYKGDPQQNLARAIDFLERSLSVFTASSHAEAFASAHNNLGTASVRRFLPDGGVDSAGAIAHYEQALAAVDRQQHPEMWGDIHNNLGGVYAALANGQAQAASHYRLALETLTEARSRQKYAQANFNLAWLLIKKSELSQGELDEAYFLANRALNSCPYQAWPELWGKIRLVLGMIYSIRSARFPGEVELAEIHFSRALSLFTPEKQPLLCLAAAYFCGEMFFQKGRYSQARRYLETGHTALEALRSELAADVSKREAAEKAALLYPLLIRCCLAGEDLPAAYEYASAMKGRAFIETLQGLPLDSATITGQDEQYGAMLLQLRRMQERIESLRRGVLDEKQGNGDEDAGRDPGAISGQAVDEIRGTMQGMSQLWENLLLKYPPLQSVQPSRPLTAQQAVALARATGCGLVEFVDTGEGWGAFVVGAELRYIPLPDISSALLGRLERWVKTVEQPAGRGLLSYRALRELYLAVFQPLKPYLNPDRPLVLAPHGPLHLLPLAAAQNPDNHRFMGEEYRIAFIPNLNALNILVERQPGGVDKTERMNFLGVAWPGEPGSAAYLSNVRLEVESIARLFSESSVLDGGSASIANVLHAAGQRRVIHFGCHGWFDRNYPEQSGLMLADGWLTIYRILTELRMQARLVSVGACLSGQARLRTGDEFTGLTQALLSSGAGAVASSLWSVHDQATRAFFEQCYQHITHGFSISEGVWAAAKKVRELPGWQHPYYWAAFQVSGLSMNGRAFAPQYAPGSPDVIDSSGMQQRGEWMVDTPLLVVNMQAVIDQMNENPAEILEALAPPQRSAFLGELERIAGEAGSVASEQALYRWAVAFFEVLAAYPALQALLMEEGDSLSEQIQRKISQSQFAGSAGQNTLAQQAAIQMRNAVLECREKLVQSVGGQNPGAQTRRGS